MMIGQSLHKRRVTSDGMGLTSRKMQISVSIYVVMIDVPTDSGRIRSGCRRRGGGG